MIHHQKLRDIVEKHLGKLLSLTIDVKSDNILKLTFVYKDKFFNVYEYKMIINLTTNEIKFITHKSTSFIKGLVLSSLEEFEQDILENMKYEF